MIVELTNNLIAIREVDTDAEIATCDKYIVIGQVLKRPIVSDTLKTAHYKFSFNSEEKINLSQISLLTLLDLNNILPKMFHETIILKLATPQVIIENFFY